MGKNGKTGRRYSAEELYRTIPVEVAGRRLKRDVHQADLLWASGPPSGTLQIEQLPAFSDEALEDRITSPMHATAVEVLVQARTPLLPTILRAFSKP